MIDLRAFRAAVAGGITIAFAISLGGCGNTMTNGDGDASDGGPDDGTDGGSNGGDDGGGYSGDPPPPDGGTPPPVTETVAVKLVPSGVSGPQRVNFALPLPPGALDSIDNVRVLAAGTELPSARRTLATHGDGSPRSVHLQVDVDVSAHQSLVVELGAPATTTALSFVPVTTTLAGTGNNVQPRVWALLPADTLAASTLFGPVIPRSKVSGTALDVWSADICNYAQWDTDAFVAKMTSRDVWLYDRVTAMYRGYAITGDLVPLRSAHREAAIYRDGMTISNGVATAIPVPTASSDLKYYYAQGLALHYLLTGDDRFREAAEAVSARVATMWDPDYSGGDEFWTERHAGFSLLAHEWAARVTDDKAAAIDARADSAVTAYFAAQMAPRYGQTDTDARCFAHTSTAHGESWGSNGCSPWMSAILAEALDDHARRVGGQRAADVNAALGRLGRIVARDGRDATGRPLYWMGVGTSADEPDYYDEHWGESAYIVALAWHVTGRTDTALRAVADQLVAGLANRGVVGQLRSFNWQCRGAVMTPALLK